MELSNKNSLKRISIDLPESLVSKFDELRKEWGFRARGPVIEKLLREVLSTDQDEVLEYESSNNIQNNIFEVQKQTINEDKALVLISNETGQILSKEKSEPISSQSNKSIEDKNIKSTSQINLPSFVKRNVKNLRKSLDKSSTDKNLDLSPIKTIKETDIKNCQKAILSHWINLYGDKPNDQVLEAAIQWLSNEIWKNLDCSDNLPFTWTGANKLMIEVCPFWKQNIASFDRVIVIAGVLEDPFATSGLINRIPTLIRRFVSSFKRSRNVTSFETLESTMTVHRALKLLGLSTQPGQSHTLKTIRDAYKSQAMENHPDAGGSTDEMRKLNEGYQLLKNLYK